MNTAWTPGARRAALRVDAADQRMRVRAAHEGRVQHAGKLQIVDEAAAALQQRQVLDPLDRLADDRGRGRHGATSPRSRAEGDTPQTR